VAFISVKQNQLLFDELKKTGTLGERAGGIAL
jgi:hypothetical protein